MCLPNKKYPCKGSTSNNTKNTPKYQQQNEQQFNVRNGGGGHGSVGSFGGLPLATQHHQQQWRGEQRESCCPATADVG